MDWAVWWPMLFEFIASMETVWVSFISVLGMHLTHVLTNRHNEKRLKSEEDRWYSQTFLEQKVEAIANLRAEVNHLARKVYKVPDMKVGEAKQELQTSCDRFYLVLLGATAYLEEGDANEMAECTAMTEEVGKRIRDRLATWGEDGSAARVEVQDYINEVAPAVFGRALKIVRDCLREYQFSTILEPTPSHRSSAGRLGLAEARESFPASVTGCIPGP